MTKQLPGTKDNMIKNPNRFKREYENLDFFIPAHVKHGITPIPQDFSALDGEIIQPEVEISSQISDIIKEPTKNKAPDIGEFVLMVRGKVISHGTHEQILNETKSILYGEHIKFINDSIKIDDLVILKRVGLKVGVFLDD